jgi:hypothetical protein
VRKLLIRLVRRPAQRSYASAHSPPARVGSLHVLASPSSPNRTNDAGSARPIPLRSVSRGQLPVCYGQMIPPSAAATQARSWFRRRLAILLPHAVGASLNPEWRLSRSSLCLSRWPLLRSSNGPLFLKCWRSHSLGTPFTADAPGTGLETDGLSHHFPVERETKALGAARRSSPSASRH